MADERLVIEAILDAAGIKAGALDAKNALSGIGSSAVTLAGQLGLVVGGAALVSSAMNTGTREVIEMQQATFRLGNTLRNLDLDARVLVPRIAGIADELQRVTLYEDDEIVAAFGRLLSITGDYEQSRKHLNLVLDIAADRDWSLVQSAQAVGMILEGNYRKLVQLNPEWANLAKEGMAVADVLDLINQRSGGAALAAAGGRLGAVNDLKKAWNEVGQSLMGGEGWDTATRGLADALRSFAALFRGEIRPILNDALLGIPDMIDQFEQWVMNRRGGGGQPTTNMNTYNWSGGFTIPGRIPSSSMSLIPQGEEIFFGPPNPDEIQRLWWQHWGPQSLDWGNDRSMFNRIRRGRGGGSSRDLFGGGEGVFGEDKMAEQSRRFWKELEAEAEPWARRVGNLLSDSARVGLNNAFKNAANEGMQDLLNWLGRGLVKAAFGAKDPFGVEKLFGA